MVSSRAPVGRSAPTAHRARRRPRSACAADRRHRPGRRPSTDASGVRRRARSRNTRAPRGTDTRWRSMSNPLRPAAISDDAPSRRARGPPDSWAAHRVVSRASGPVCTTTTWRPTSCHLPSPHVGPHLGARDAGGVQLTPRHRPRLVAREASRPAARRAALRDAVRGAFGAVTVATVAASIVRPPRAGRAPVDDRRATDACGRLAARRSPRPARPASYEAAPIGAGSYDAAAATARSSTDARGAGVTRRRPGGPLPAVSAYPGTSPGPSPAGSGDAGGPQPKRPEM